MPRLIDGREVSSTAPEWRIECLARSILSLPLAKRRAWLEDFDKKNPAVGQELRQVVAAVHADAKRQKVTKTDGTK